MKKLLLVAILINLVFASCVKKQTEEELIQQNCELIADIHIVGAKDLYYVGDTLELTVNKKADIAFFDWSRDPSPNIIDQGWTYTEPYLTKSKSGTYRLLVHWEDCMAKPDSVHIRVINRPVAAPCSPGTDQVYFSELPEPGSVNVTQDQEPLTGRRQMRGYRDRNYPDLRITFNSFWNQVEPEDGAYLIGGINTLSDQEPYTLYITSLFDSITFSATGGKAYVSHVNGKLTVTFCDIIFTGSNGSMKFQTDATASITVP